MPSDPTVFDELKLPFIFVPHGEPEPTEWLQDHPNYIKLPATMVPRAPGNGRADGSPGGPRPGQQRFIDGLPAPPGSGAPSPPPGNTTPNAVQAATNEAPDRASTLNNPIAAYLRANEALTTAANGYVPDLAAAGNPPPDVDNTPADRRTLSGLLAEQVAGAIGRAIIPSAEAKEGSHTQAVHQQLQPKFENFFNQLYGPASKIAKDLNVPVEFVLGVAAKESGYYSVQHDIDFNNPWGSTHHGVNDVVFGLVRDAAAYWEKSNAWRFTDGPPMTNSAFIRDLKKVPAYNSADKDYYPDLDSIIDSVRSRLTIWLQEHPQN